MFTGKGKFQLIDVAGIADQVERLAADKRFGDVEKLLQGRKTEVYESPNAINHNLAGWLFWQIFSGMTRPYTNNADNFGHATIGTYLSSLATDNPAFSTDELNSYYNWYRDSRMNLPNLIDGTGYYTSYKANSEIIETPKCWTEPMYAGKRAIYRSMKWMWVPQEANSTNINSVRFIVCNNAQDCWGRPSYEASCRQFSRLRLKDNNGNMISISKNNTKVLIFEYTIRLMSL